MGQHLSEIKMVFNIISKLTRRRSDGHMTPEWHGVVCGGTGAGERSGIGGLEVWLLSTRKQGTRRRIGRA